MFSTANMEDERCSNVLEVELPLDYAGIELHISEQKRRESNPDGVYYDEYLEIHEGAGYLPNMKGENMYWILFNR